MITEFAESQLDFDHEEEPLEPSTLPDHSSRSSIPFGHLGKLLTDYGLWQHATGDIPHQEHGYSIDDEARGLLVAIGYRCLENTSPFIDRLGDACFRFIERASIVSGETAGQYHNFADADGRWLDSVGSEDSFGRTLWSLGIAWQADTRFAPRDRVERLLSASLANVPRLTYVRAKSFSILGLAGLGFADDLVRSLADDLLSAYRSHSTADWRWFGPDMTYCNARMPQALFAASRLFPQREDYLTTAVDSLDFLLQSSRSGKNGYAPIGNAPMHKSGWFKRGDKRPPMFDQQPVDARALTECCAEAFSTTGEPRFREAMHKSFGWYWGENVHNVLVVNPFTGGVADALTRSGLNDNQGAELAVSIHLAYLALKAVE